MKSNLFTPFTTDIDTLFSHIKAGDLQQFKTQLDLENKPGNIQMRNNNGANLAHLAAISNQIPILQYLADQHHPLLHQKTQLGFKPIDYAIINQDIPLFKSLADITWHDVDDFQNMQSDSIRLIEYAKKHFGESSWFTQRLAVDLNNKVGALKKKVHPVIKDHVTSTTTTTTISA